MRNNDDYITDYDTSILKDNIRRRMKEMNITQTALASETGIPQPTISKVLSNKDSSCFTIPQLVLIKQVLNTSTDELLGITSKETHQIDNLGDVAKYLLELSKYIPVKFNKVTVDASPHEEGSYEMNDSFNSFFLKDYYAIYFENKHIDKFVKNWWTVSTSIEDDECRDEVLNAWETSKIRELKKYESRYSFLTAEEKGVRICEEIHSMVESYYYDKAMPEILSEEELALATYWIKQKHAFKKCEPIEYNNIRQSVSTYINWLKDTKQDIELPFN